MSVKLRSEAEERFTWNFCDIYPSDEAWEKAYAEAETLIDRIPAVQGTLGNSAESLKAGLDCIYEALEKAEKVFIYSMLRKNVDNGAPCYQAMAGRAMNLNVKLSTACAFVDPEILSIDETLLREYMASPALATYRHTLEDTARMRSFTKSAETERLLAMLSDAAGTASDCFEMLESVGHDLPNHHRRGRKHGDADAR